MSTPRPSTGRRVSLGALLVAACAPAAAPDDGGDSGGERVDAIDLPEHGECLPVGERYSDEVCRAVVEEAGRIATVSENKTSDSATDDDPRLDDPELAWVTGEFDRCACRCCHTTGLDGAGIYQYDLAFSPVWVDSASTWVLTEWGGWGNDPTRVLPTDDLDRLRAWIYGEIDRRYPPDG